MKTKINGIKIVTSESVPKDTFYISNGIDIIEKYNKSGELLDVEMKYTNGDSVPFPKFISEYKERIKNFGKRFVFFEEKEKE